MRLGFILMLLFVPNLLWSEVRVQNLAGENWQFKNASSKQWYSAQVPGNIHKDLLHHRLIPDPYLAANEKLVQWVEAENWTYQCNFTLTKESLQFHQIELSFENLDTYATIYLNGQLIGNTNNQFRAWKYLVKSLLKIGKNELKIDLKSALKQGREKAKKLPYTLPGGEAVWTRKGQYQYGWDWGPRLITCGIGKVNLSYWNEARIVAVQNKYDLKKDASAEVILQLKIESEKFTNSHVEVSIKGLSFQQKTWHKLSPGINEITLHFKLNKVNLWWTNGLGEPSLYKFEISLKEHNKTLDTTSFVTGFRTLEVCQEKDSMGKEFAIKLNGIKVFMKGANYIPPHNFLNGLNRSIYADLVNQAAAVHMNMLRVWGGGVYADEAFYDACDRKGILVWQDFMFACAMYPSDTAFLDNVKEEAKFQISRLNKHVSLGIWCGNNEVDEAWNNWGWQKQYQYTAVDSSAMAQAYHNLFLDLLPKAVAQLDSGRFYWPSSPSNGWGRPASLKEGDLHYWGVWWGLEPFEKYEQKAGRFVSEYGFQGMPNIHSMNQFMQGKEDLLDSTILLAHQKHPTGFETIKTYMERDYKLPNNFKDFIYVSQLLQARGMQIAIEAHRRAMPYCMGTLYWQLNDCWPVSSWSSIDYYGRKKAFHYELTRLYNELLISFETRHDSILVYVVSDKLKPSKGNLRLKLVNFEGKVLFTNIIQVEIVPQSSAVYGVWFEPNLKEFNPKNCVLMVELNTDLDTIQTNYYFNKPKDLDLKVASINLKIEGNHLLISSNTLVKNLYLVSARKLPFF
ncbi:MAG: glycoside hydrolase family 2 protein [bacterium]|nr:glycoside hydrolase family 2 protein [bacterium]